MVLGKSVASARTRLRVTLRSRSGDGLSAHGSFNIRKYYNFFDNQLTMWEAGDKEGRLDMQRLYSCNLDNLHLPVGRFM